jgi:DNA-binding transcriptional ArsR family regulator
VLDVEVIADRSAAEASLDPIRRRLLSELMHPASAAALAPRVGLSRQTVNYHLRLLEVHGLIKLIEERRKGNCTERILQATASSYVISPDALGNVPPDSVRNPDPRSARWLLALAAQLVRDLVGLLGDSRRAGRRLATFALEGEIRFASAADRGAFTEDLAGAGADLIARYHDETAPGGRRHRLVLALHPTMKTQPREPREGDH